MPGSTARPSRRGRPPSFTQDELVEAARSLGPDGINLRQVAELLGVARTSLYWHVRDQDALGELVLTSILNEGGSTAEPAPDASWDEWLTTYARDVRQTLIGAGGWLRFGTSRVFYDLRTLVHADRMLGALVEQGFSPEEATFAFTMMAELVAGNVRTRVEDNFRRQQGKQAFIDAVQAADPGHLPNLWVAIKQRAAVSSDQQFEYDLACALAGIRARISTDADAAASLT